MVTFITDPDPQALLPPLLACLPTAFASSRPPPPLLPLLSPVLRQRLQLLSSTNDNWLRLLCWDGGKAESLREIVENTNFEPHPVSGEIELGDVDKILYKRFDSETLKAYLALPDWNLSSLYLWCTGSDEGNAWRLAELMPYDQGVRNDQTWSQNVSEANDSAKERLVAEALRSANAAERRPSLRVDEDDYWNQYDDSRDRTPAIKRSPAPNRNQTSEEDYYAQYGAVQPALDNHDPDEEMQDTGGSTLNGNALSAMFSRHSDHSGGKDPPPYEEAQSVDEDREHDTGVEVSQPVPASPSSTGSDTVARLEKSAEQYSASEIAVKQHVSTSMKSMYRLARNTGMGREEFDRIVRRELETLSLLDSDD